MLFPIFLVAVLFVLTFVEIIFVLADNDILQRLQRVLNELDELKATNKRLVNRIVELENKASKVDKLEKDNHRLKKEVSELKEKLSKYENPKNSKNSSIPPSQDPNRETRSLRGKSNKKIGGQPGHKGYKLKKIEVPDEIILHDITKCECCNAALPSEGEIKSRQVFDIPKIKIRVTEHRIMVKTCTNCGKENKSNFPEGVVQEAQYGNRIKALSVYLQNYQMLPYQRTTEMIYALTGQKISQGTLANFQTEMHQRLSTFEEQIKSLLLLEGILHADETGVKVNGKGNWMHVASTGLLSFFGFHQKRGKEAIDSFNILPLYNGVLAHDRFGPYFKYGKEHTLCNAHILRDLLYIRETGKKKWAKDLSNLLTHLHQSLKQGKEFTEKNYQNIVKRWEEIIAPTINGYNKKYKKTKEESLAFALEKHKHLFLKFVKNKHIPFDNNQAERDLRMIKVKQKISGGFKEYAYAEYFARARAFISTLKKNNKNILENMNLAFNIDGFFPNLAE